MYIQRSLDLQGILSSRSLFLFGPRKTGKSSYIKNQLSGMDIALTWNLLDGKASIAFVVGSEPFAAGSGGEKPAGLPCGY